MRFVAYGDRKGVATALRPVYTAPDEEAARRAPGAFRQSDPGPRAPADGGDVGEGLGEVHPLPGLPPGPAPGHLCTTNAIESLNHRAARSAENRGHFPSDEAAVKLLWLAICNIEDRRAAERAKEKNTPAHSRRANGWTRRRGGSPPTGAHRPRARPARRRLPRPNQPPPLTEPAYTETLTGSGGRPHLSNDDDISPTAVEHRHHRNHHRRPARHGTTPPTKPRKIQFPVSAPVPARPEGTRQPPFPARQRARGAERAGTSSPRPTSECRCPRDRRVIRENVPWQTFSRVK